MPLPCPYGDKTANISPIHWLGRRGGLAIVTSSLKTRRRYVDRVVIRLTEGTTCIRHTRRCSPKKPPIIVGLKWVIRRIENAAQQMRGEHIMVLLSARRPLTTERADPQLYPPHRESTSPPVAINVRAGRGKTRDKASCPCLREF